MEHFSERLRWAREEAKLTQPELAQKLSISKGTVGNWESGQNYPGHDNLRRLADVLNVSESFLRGESDRPERIVPGHGLLQDETETYGGWVNEEDELIERRLSSLASALPAAVNRTTKVWILEDISAVTKLLRSRFTALLGSPAGRSEARPASSGPLSEAQRLVKKASGESVEHP